MGIHEPCFGDSIYHDSKKSFDEVYGQYQRDHLLWEQTQALQKQNELIKESISQSKSNSASTSTYYSDYDSSYDSDIPHFNLTYNYYKPNTKNYIEFDKFLNKRDKLEIKANRLDDIRVFFLFIFTILICMGLPALIIINQALNPYLRLVIQITFIVTILSLLILKGKITEIGAQISKIDDEIFNFKMTHTKK